MLCILREDQLAVVKELSQRGLVGALIRHAMPVAQARCCITRAISLLIIISHCGCRCRRVTLQGHKQGSTIVTTGTNTHVTNGRTSRSALCSLYLIICFHFALTFGFKLGSM